MLSLPMMSSQLGMNNCYALLSKSTMVNIFEFTYTFWHSFNSTIIWAVSLQHFPSFFINGQSLNSLFLLLFGSLKQMIFSISSMVIVLQLFYKLSFSWSKVWSFYCIIGQRGLSICIISMFLAYILNLILLVNKSITIYYNVIS